MRRGDPLKNPPSPRCIAIAVQNLVALSQTVSQRVNGLVAPPSWVEVIYVIPLYGDSWGLNLNLSSVGGHCLKLTDYYRAEARCYLPDRAKTEADTMRQSRGRGSKVETEARPCEAEARPSQLKKLPRGCLEPRQMPRGLHPCKTVPFH